MIRYSYSYQLRCTALSEVAKEHGLAAALAGHRDLNIVSKHYVKHSGEIPVANLVST